MRNYFFALCHLIREATGYILFADAEYIFAHCEYVFANAERMFAHGE